MPSVTRRGFITKTSLSLAAIGALGAVGPLPTLADAASQPFSPPTAIPAGEPFMVYVGDPSTGAGTILVGEQAIPFTNGAVVQALRQAIG